jgi:hypothetical protein
MTDHEQIRRSALDLVNGLIAGAEAEEWETAGSFVTMTTNAETHSIHIDGWWPHAPSALAWAAQHADELNNGMGEDEDPFTVTVLPVQHVNDVNAEKLADERNNVKNLLEVITDLVGDHCASHLEPELTCTTCTALAFLEESKYWEGQRT